MGHSYRTYLAGESLLTCRTCNNHLAVGESVLSKVSHLVFNHQFRSGVPIILSFPCR